MKLLLVCLLAPSLYAQSVIEGAVANAATGAPIAGVNIEFRRGNDTVAKASTDAQGAYRIDSLRPGVYTVIFGTDGFAGYRERAVAGAAPVRVDAKLTPYSTVAGRVLAPGGKPIANASVQLLAVGVISTYDDEANRNGEFTLRNVRPGTYVLSVRPPKDFPPPASDDDHPRTWARTYHPGTERREGAGKLTITAGANVFGQDIVLRSIPARRLRGRVLNVNGDPVAAASVKLIPDNEWIIRDVEQQVHTDPQGAFEFPRLYDGGWKVEVEVAEPKMAADRRLEISGDIDGLDIRMNPPFSLSGRMVLDPDVPVPHIGALLIPPGSGSHFYQGAIGDGGAFRIEGVTEGQYTVRVPGVMAPDYIASIRLGDREILGEVVDLISGALPLTVMLKRDGGSVRGAVDDGAASTVILIPQDPKLLAMDFAKTAVCNGNGAFELASLRPGEYYAYAFTEPPGPLEYGVLRLAPTTNQAVRVTVRPNEATQISLKLLPRP